MISYRYDVSCVPAQSNHKAHVHKLSSTTDPTSVKIGEFKSSIELNVCLHTNIAQTADDGVLKIGSN